MVAICNKLIDNLVNREPLIRFTEVYSKAGEGGTPETSKSEYYENGNIPFIKIDDLSNKYIISNDFKKAYKYKLEEDNLVSTINNIELKKSNKLKAVSEKDIIEVYGKENLSQCKKYFKKILYDNEEYLYNKYNNERR